MSLGTFETVAACYDSLVEFEKIVDPGDPDALREDIKDYPERPGRVNMKGKLAEKLGGRPDSQWVRFKLREGVKSNWGNELTAEDVVWTWHRKLELGAIGGFFANTISLKRKEQIKAEDKYVVSFNLDHPNPLLLKLQPNLYNPIYDSTKCQEAGGADDPVGQGVPEERDRRLRPLPWSSSSRAGRRRSTRRATTITAASRRWTR